MSDRDVTERLGGLEARLGRLETLLGTEPSNCFCAVRITPSLAICAGSSRQTKVLQRTRQ